jgi:hypothetical protein
MSGKPRWLASSLTSNPFLACLLHIEPVTSYVAVAIAAVRRQQQQHTTLTVRKHPRTYNLHTITMPRALILIADGSEEIEFVTPYDSKELTILSHRSHVELTPSSPDSCWHRDPVRRGQPQERQLRNASSSVVLVSSTGD